MISTNLYLSVRLIGLLIRIQQVIVIITADTPAWLPARVTAIKTAVTVTPAVTAVAVAVVMAVAVK